jgi:hypothetical protein
MLKGMAYALRNTLVEETPMIGEEVLTRRTRRTNDPLLEVRRNGFSKCDFPLLTFPRSSNCNLTEYLRIA